MIDPQALYLQKSDLLVHQAIALVDREQAAMILFDAAVKALTLDMDGNAAIDVARQWAGALRVS
ncbi:MAG: hypothetical protein ACLGIM_12455 [Alphaproteobacteria bacterium]